MIMFPLASFRSPHGLVRSLFVRPLHTVHLLILPVRSSLIRLPSPYGHLSPHSITTAGKGLVWSPLVPPSSSSSSLPHSTRPSRLSSSPPHVSLYPFPHPSSSLRLVTHLPFPSPSVHRAEPGPTGEVMSGRMERVSEPAVGARSHLTFPLSLIAFRLFTRSLREVKPSRR